MIRKKIVENMNFGGDYTMNAFVVRSIKSFKYYLN